ncbi:MAG TPA: MFS transporter [Victivallales bacterium]|nr:MFS transporter [Victivallales bacterium]
MTKLEKKIIFITLSGQIIEFFEFSYIILLANIISENFFPSSSIYIRYLELSCVFAIGYIARPFGGVIFGHFGDIKGRKNTFLATILLISISTIAIALIPSHKTIGILAPILFVIFRILQGISLGGELPGAVSFVHEHLAQNKRIVGTALIVSGAFIGGMLSSAVIFLLYSTVKDSFISVYGWRIPIIISGLFGFLIFYLRYTITETPEFLRILKHNQVYRFPIIEVFKTSFTHTILSILVLLFGAFGTVFMYVLPDVLSSYLKFYNPQYVFLLNTIFTLFLVFYTPFSANLIQKKKLNVCKFFGIGTLVIAVLALPLFFLINLRSELALFFVYFVYSTSFGLVYSTVFYIASEEFPTAIKYSGLSVTFNLGSIVSSGIVPLSTIIFLKYFGVYGIAYFIIITCIISAIGAFFLLKFPPSPKKIEELDKKIREIYGLLKKNVNLSTYEEATMIKKLNNLAYIIVKTKCFRDIKEQCINEVDLKNGLSNIPKEQRAYLCNNVKKILIEKISSTSSSMRDYKEIISSSKGNKYFLYFLNQLIYLEVMASNSKKLTLANLDTFLNKNVMGKI